MLNDYPLDALLDTIDWMPFFNAWEFSGRFPDILNDPRKGPEARQLFEDAQGMLDRIIDEKWLRADAVAGCFPAYSEGNSIVILDPEDHERELLRTHWLRQQRPMPHFTHPSLDSLYTLSKHCMVDSIRITNLPGISVFYFVYTISIV